MGSFARRAAHAKFARQRRGCLRSVDAIGRVISLGALPRTWLGQSHGSETQQTQPLCRVRLMNHAAYHMEQRAKAKQPGQWSATAGTISSSLGDNAATFWYSVTDLMLVESNVQSSASQLWHMHQSPSSSTSPRDLHEPRGEFTFGSQQNTHIHSTSTICTSVSLGR